MIHVDGERTIADNTPRDEDWRTRIERDLAALDRLTREAVYIACRENTDNVFDWLACLDGATSGT